MDTASKPLRIRIRCPSVSPGPILLESCTAETTFANFRGEVMNALGLQLPAEGDEQAAERVELPTILAGFPPRPLNLADDVAIGSVLSDNENLTVRLADESTGVANPKGGSWGRSRRKKTPAAAATVAPASRASTRASRSTTPSTAPSDAGNVSSVANQEMAAMPSTKGKTKAKASTNAGGVASASVSSSGGRNGNSSGAGGNGAPAGIHTLNGPLASSPARRRVGASSHSGGRGSGSSPPGQVRTLFGSRSGGRFGSSTAAGRGGGSVEESAAAVAPGGGSSRKRVRPATGVALRSEADIGETLLRAVSGGGQGTADKFFRKAMRLAVDKQYDQSKADARVRAALGKWYTAEEDTVQRRLGDGQSVALKVSFSKGDGAKSRFEETVDRIPPAQVAAVVRMIARDAESREMLKPHNMAGCSPRMFWSLVEHWGGDVPAALRQAAPDVDWGFLETRERKPSEKAVANAVTEEAQRRQAEEEKAERLRKKAAKQKERERKRRRREGIASDSQGEEEDAACAATEPSPGTEPQTAPPPEVTTGGNAVAPSDPQLAASAAAQLRRRAADAALSRLAMAQQHPGGVADDNQGDSNVPPDIPSAAAAGDEDTDEEGLTKVAGGKESAAKLLVAAGVRTIGQLADRDEDELARKLRVLQAAVARSGDDSAGAGVGGEAGGGCAEVEESEERVDAEEVSEWVQAARGEELDEIMFEIVGSDDDVVEALEEVSVATPRDLVRLGGFPDVLLEAVRDKLGPERFATLEDKITTKAIADWRVNGERVIERRPWLELWISQ